MLAFTSDNRGLFEYHRANDSPDCCVVAFSCFWRLIDWNYNPVLSIGLGCVVSSFFVLLGISIHGPCYRVKFNTFQIIAQKTRKNDS